jgi:urease accessory protein
MILVEKIVGNSTELNWVNALEEYEIDHLFLEQWEAPKNRIRKNSQQGYEIAISLPRTEQLKNKDIIYIDEVKKVAVIAHIALKDVMVIHLTKLEKIADWQRLLFQLGHALGNQHWPAIFKHNCVYVPFYVDRKIMTSVMGTHAFEGLTVEFMAGDDVAPLLEANELRLLFAGVEPSSHKHHITAEDEHNNENNHEH